MSTGRQVVLIHGTWGRGDQWAPARASFEERGYTVHSPTLRHHELPVAEGAAKIALLSVRDYVDDLVALVDGLDSPPVLVGHSLGGLLAQLVAVRTRQVGVVAATPSTPAGIFNLYPSLLRVFIGHFLRVRPWTKPLYPVRWEVWRDRFVNAQSEHCARALFSGLVCESGRAYCEMGFPWLDRGDAATVDFSSVTTPVLAIGAGSDRLVPTRIARQTATRYQKGSYVEIAGADHFVFTGDSLPVIMSHIDDWIANNVAFV
jgi:pimeloyl-ACP methyl ester carboxylesterase